MGKCITKCFFLNFLAPFNGCTQLTSVPINLPTTVINMIGVFKDATAFNSSNISSWDVSNVTNMAGMFAGATSFNQSLSSWDVSSLQNASNMFSGATSFDQDISGWEVLSLQNASSMFASATSFDQDISGWNVSSVIDMNGMFIGATAFNNGGQPFDWADISNVTDMSGMFQGATAFNQDISDWNVSSVENMSNMFQGATSFNQSLSGWNVSSVMNMISMFAEATSFNQNIGMWDISAVIDMSNMLDYSGMDISNYDSILNGWATGGYAPTGITLGAFGVYYDATGLLGRNALINNYGWIIAGDIFSPIPICYSKGVKILTCTGYIAIEHLLPGDLIKTYRHGYIPIELIRKGKFNNDPTDWKKCMYRLPGIDGHDDLIVTGGHGILKRTLSSHEIQADLSWFKNNRRYSKIDGLYLQRAAFCKDFHQIKSTEEYTYYHLSLKGSQRYGIWANGVLSESTFSRDILNKVFK